VRLSGRVLNPKIVIIELNEDINKLDLEQTNTESTSKS
jgi:hypothetical protein